MRKLEETTTKLYRYLTLYVYLPYYGCVFSTLILYRWTEPLERRGVGRTSNITLEKILVVP